MTLVRHPPVADSIVGFCYGASDVPLGPEGIAVARELVVILSQRSVTRIVHTGLSRTAVVAEGLAERIGIPTVADFRLRERHFGTWELRRWDDIYAETGEEMMGIIQAPDSWRPPGGETLFEMRDRALAWYHELPADGHSIAIAHGGPIAAILGTLQGVPAAEWVKLIPRPGQIVSIS
ncbi:histidine phosphatase family protein [Limnoglobus roseus]|uniref:histidine phosphatase family protein n=1 Tax=Limnoglobus roseus TaxID=2598579 RepID=UPI00143D58A6|nr:histidine phosphatase family protein [Limnoglobus roseus]